MPSNGDPYYRYYDPDDPYDPYNIAMSRYSHFHPEDPPQAPGWRPNTGSAASAQQIYGADGAAGEGEN